MIHAGYLPEVFGDLLGGTFEANDIPQIEPCLACSLGAGALLDTLGWQRLNLLLVPWLIAAGIALLWFAVRERRDAVG